jgi:hypothetical protein
LTASNHLSVVAVFFHLEITENQHLIRTESIIKRQVWPSLQQNLVRKLPEGYKVALAKLLLRAAFLTSTIDLKCKFNHDFESDSHFYFQERHILNTAMQFDKGLEKPKYEF